MSVRDWVKKQLEIIEMIEEHEKNRTLRMTVTLDVWVAARLEAVGKRLGRKRAEIAADLLSVAVAEAEETLGLTGKEYLAEVKEIVSRYGKGQENDEK